MARLLGYYSSGEDNTVTLTTTTGWVCQTVTPDSSGVADTASIYCYKNAGGDDFTVQVDLYAVDGDGKPTGSALATSTGVAASSIPTGYASRDWVSFNFATGYAVSSSTQYALVAHLTAYSVGTLSWVTDSIGAAYTGGQLGQSANSGSTWTMTSTVDCYFRLATLTPLNKIYSRKLIAIANNEVWYETASDTMTELAAANGGIDCAEPLEAVEAYQKLFIVNKTNQKVLDFINTKINTADAGSNPCTVDMTLTGGTSGAAMVVNYADGVTDDAAANIYGYRTTEATFSSGETVTGTNSNGDAVSFVLSAAETAPPHWYDWTVFGNDTTNYGTQPTSSTLVALYRGRLVRNDNNNPHAWVMSKVGFPYKVLYDTTNDGDMSAVAYSNNLVGHIGDIITALITYKDDLLIFGCANSIWILIGDPLADGQLAQITKETGIWGSRSWCIDGESNLYFLGNDGVYKLPIAETVTNVTNISKLRIPNLIKDWDLDASLHRVTMSYDPVNKGLLIERTLLSDGTNTGYWYDLTTEGFFKESYPASCGIFSSHFYQATDETYKKFHIGCVDGYIREFDNSTLNDATTSSTTAIDSYATMIKQLGEDEDAEGILREISGILAGGASTGDFSDSDSLSWYLYPADDAETALEDVIDGATEFTSGTWTGPGKSDKSYPRMGGYWCALKIRNNTASETWAVDRIYSSIIPKRHG